MKMKPLIAFIILITSFQINEVHAQTDEDAARSVVKIKTTFKGPDANGKIVTKNGNGTGWCYGNGQQIVTALHVVAGIPDEDIIVYTDRESKSSGAKVISVLKEADLALLQLDESLGLTPLNLEDTSHNATDEFYIWGFPHGIFQMGGDHIRFSRSIGPPPTLNSLVNKTDFKFTLESQGYPLPKAQILRVSSTIQPGHSGAPIITSKGAVVGVADGGLRSGTARLNWAFPANLYVPRLLNSNEPFPSSASLQANLYASYTTVPDDADEATQNRIMEAEARNNVVSGGNQEISKIWTLSYDEILATMNKEDQDDLDKENRLMEVSNMNSTRYDVYEDFKTGATITIPSGKEMFYEDGWFYTTNASSTLHYYASVFDADNFENAQDNVDDILEDIFEIQFFDNPATWYEDDEEPDEVYMEEGEWEYAEYYITRYADDPDRMLIFNAAIDQSELLVVFLVVDEDRMWDDPEIRREFLQFETALELADFAEY
jgi:hypothetical protein